MSICMNAHGRACVELTSRRRHLGVVTNCSVCFFLGDQGIRRIAFQQLLNTPVRRRRSSLWSGQSGTADDFLSWTTFGRPSGSSVRDVGFVGFLWIRSRDHGNEMSRVFKRAASNNDRAPNASRFSRIFARGSSRTLVLRWIRPGDILALRRSRQFAFNLYLYRGCFSRTSFGLAS